VQVTQQQLDSKQAAAAGDFPFNSALCITKHICGLQVAKNKPNIAVKRTKNKMK
jgi:hypothetical protein